MKRYLRLFCVFMVGLLLGLSLFGCTSRVTVQELSNLNPDAAVIDECVRMPIGRGRADIWALRRSTGQMVSDREPERLRHFVKMADVIYHFNPGATRRNLAALPWPYQHMQCESQSPNSTQKLPAKLPELPISSGSRAALVSILTNECVAEPLAPMSVNKEFFGQVGVPISVATKPYFTREHMDEVAQAMRDALRGEIHRLVMRGPLGETAIGKFRPTLVDDSGNVIDTPGGQLVGGFAGGVMEGAAPAGALITQAMIDSGVLPKGTREARAGKALGEIGVGAAQTFIGVDGAIIGGGLTLTGGGAVVGVPVCIGGVALATNGAITFCNGVKSLAIVLCKWEDEQPALATSAPPAAATPAAPAPKPVAQPTQSAAKPATSPPQPAAKPAPGQTPAPPKGRPGGIKMGKNTTMWYKCTGQWHHGITKQIHTALEDHPLLKGLYKYRDDRFVTQAIDKAAHKGWQKWHRAMEEKVVDWIASDRTITPKQFEAWLRNLYKTDNDLNWRFPNGF